MTRKNWKTIVINILEEDYQKLRIMAALNKKPLATYVRDILKPYIERGENVQNKLDSTSEQSGSL